MGLRLILAVAALTGLTACGESTRDYPALLPTAVVLAEPAIPRHAAEAATDDSLGAALDARGKALAGRAGGPPMASNADLATRADALRRRAQTLSQQQLDAADCSTDQPDCAGQAPQE